jgi:UDP:flavonoid glycosyltransferase YjiC (YdhE family)
VLFIAEAVTVAQVVRLVVLARSLDPERYEVHFACASFDDLFFRGTDFRRWSIRSLSVAQVEAAIARGRRIYDEDTLASYVREERALLARIRPALVIGDLRLSLCVSAPLAGVPHATLINAYWSPYAVRDGFPMPDHPLVRLLGVARAARYFPRAAPLVFEHFARPVNTLRRRHGLAPIGSLAEVLTHGDYTLYADVPALVPTRELPASHHYLGPVLWSPALDLPPPWPRTDTGRPRVYATLGASGKVDLAPLVVEVLGRLDVDALVATARRWRAGSAPPNVRVVDFVDGAQAARHATLVISNGGSSTGYQALAEGSPVLGLPFNLDQYLAMTAIERVGAGRLVRAGTATADTLLAMVEVVLRDCSQRRAAERVRSEFARFDAAARFAALVDAMCV